MCRRCAEPRRRSGAHEDMPRRATPLAPALVCVPVARLALPARGRKLGVGEGPAFVLKRPQQALEVAELAHYAPFRHAAVREPAGEWGGVMRCVEADDAPEKLQSHRALSDW